MGHYFTNIKNYFLFSTMLLVSLSCSAVDYLDTTFGPDATGIVKTTINSFSVINGITVDSSGKILVTGNTTINGNQNLVIAKYNSNGTLDTSFNSAGAQPGVVTTLAGSFFASGNAIAVDSNDDIFAVGANGSGQILVVKYTSSGSLDTTFDGGIVTVSIGDGGSANAVVIDGNGKVVIGGTAVISGQANLFVARINTDGTLDTSFNTTGYNAITGSSNYTGTSVKLDSNAKIIAGGAASGNNGTDFLVARFDGTDGSLDTTFNSTGIVTTEVSSDNNDSVQSIVITSTDQIIASGYVLDSSSNGSFALAKYNTDGTLDTSFGINSTGIVIQSVGTNAQALSSVIDLDGNIVLGGFSDSKTAVARFDANGSIDTTFGTNGIIITALDNFFSSINSLAVQPSDGRVVAGGYTTTDNAGNTDFALIRYNKNNTDFVDITSIADNSTINTKIPTIAGTSSGTTSPQASVQIIVNGVSINTVNTDASGNWNATTTPPTVLPEGQNTIQANLIINSQVVVSHVTKFTVVSNLSEDSVFAYNTTSQTKTGTSSFSYSSLPFNNTPILGTWTYSSNVFTCRSSGKYQFIYNGIAGATALGILPSSINISMMVSFATPPGSASEYLGSGSNTNIDLLTSDTQVIAKGFIKDLVAGDTVRLNYSVNQTSENSTAGLIANGGNQYPYSLTINRIG